MGSTKKTVILVLALAILLPIVYAAKLTRWLPPYGADQRNLFEVVGANAAHLVSMVPNQDNSTAVPAEASEADNNPVLVPEKIFVAPQKPYRVLITGDSFVAVAGGFGDILEQKMIGYNDVVVQRLGKVSSGLSRPDYFDWDKEASAAINSFNPNVAVIMMGTNDAQSFEIVRDGKKSVLQYGSAQWDEEYSRRAEAFVQLFTGRGIALYWVGLPVMRDPVYATKIAHVSDLQKQAIERDPMAKFFSGQELMVPGNSNYQPFSSDEKGVMRATRNSDGVHMSYFGGTILVDKFTAKLGEDIQLALPAAPKTVE